MAQNIGGLTETDFQGKVLIEWTPLTSNDPLFAEPYFVGVLDSSVAVGNYLLFVTSGKLFLYEQADFEVDPAFIDVALKISGTPTELGAITVDVPIQVFPTMTITFQYEVPVQASYHFVVKVQWDWLEDLAK